ncbi:hypothetical protein HZY86_04845 [Aerococcaceae bacterium DSM 111020]|nr:hypothetical protein [Aerococcaceae bacterium DSM 111020]
MTLKKLTTLMLTASILLMQVTPIIAQEEGGESTVQQPPVNEESSVTTEPEVTQPDPGSTGEIEPTNPPQESSGPSSDLSSSENDQSSGNTGTPSRPPANPRPTQPTTPSRPPRGETIIPSNPQYSNDPEDFGETTPIEKPEIEVVEESEDESMDDTIISVDESEEVGLLDGPYVAFNANVFLSEEEADAFITMIEEDPEAEGRFITNKIINDNGSVIVTVEYAEDADANGRPILLYVETSFDTEEEALEYGQKYLTVMPDLFFDAEVFQLEDEYHVVFGIRHTADTLAFDYDSENDFEIYYHNERLPFTYQISADENGEFYDPIPAAVEEAYPGEFIFEETMLSETVKSVTMTPVENTEESVDGTEDSEEISDESVNE